MNKKQSNKAGGPDEQLLDRPTSLDVVSEYVAALAVGDNERMNSCCSPDFVLDAVSDDAFESGPLSLEEMRDFWPSWFMAFPEMDYEVTRTIAAEEVVVTEWIFTGTNSEPLLPPIFPQRRPATGRTIRLRGVSIYDVSEGLIERETSYIDLATLMVELGVEL